MRISDWSSDVCSSDLTVARRPSEGLRGRRDGGQRLGDPAHRVNGEKRHENQNDGQRQDGRCQDEVPRIGDSRRVEQEGAAIKIGSASCRERVCRRVYLGGRRIIKKKKTKTLQK